MALQMKMQNELSNSLDKINKLIQDEDFDEADSFIKIMNTEDILNLTKNHSKQELLVLLDNIQSAISVITIKKSIVLDELTLLNKSRKALTLYTSLP